MNRDGAAASIPLRHLTHPQSALLARAYARTPFNLAATLVIAILGVGILWTFVPHPVLWIWAAALLFNGLAGTAMVLAHRAWYTEARRTFWANLFAVHATYAGLSWSVGPALLIMPMSGAAPVFFVALVLAVSAVVLVSMAEHPVAMQGFVAAACLPPAFVIAVQGTGFELLVALVLVAAAGILVAVGHVSHLAQRSLVENRSRTEAILATAPDGVIGVDAKGLITSWNAAAERMLGWTPDQAVGQSVAKLAVPVHLQAAFQSGLERVMGINQKAASLPRTEMRVNRRDGSELAVEVAITPLVLGATREVTVFVSDISMRKTTEERLSLYRRVFDASDQCVCITDPKGRIVYQNQAQARFVGYTDAEIQGQDFSLLLAPEHDSMALLKELARSSQGQHGWTGQVRLRKKDGSLFVAANSVGFIRDEAGHVQYAFNIYKDFGPELARRNELARARDAAESANQAKSVFLSSMSHELRTPLNAILGFAQVLELEQGLSAHQRESVAEILKASRHLQMLVDDVLDLSKIDSGAVALNLETIDLAKVVDECRPLLAGLLQRQEVRIDTALSGATWIVADRTRLKQVLVNLLSNAIKYNRRGGEVLLKTRFGGEGFWRIEVHDQGKGIAPERIKQLFQPFNRLGAEGGTIEGTDIGLVITRRLVELMGGRIGVNSEPGVGTCFWIDLPGSDAMPTVAGPLADLALAPSPRRSLLMATDNPIDHLMVRRVLAARTDLTVLAAEDVDAALRLLRDEAPDVLLVDTQAFGAAAQELRDAWRMHLAARPRSGLVLLGGLVGVWAVPPAQAAAWSSDGRTRVLDKPLAARALRAEVDAACPPWQAIASR